MRLGDQMVPELVKSIKTATNISSLDLTAIALTSYGLRNFAELYLAENPRNLISLDLTSNKFNDV